MSNLDYEKYIKGFEENGYKVLGVSDDSDIYFNIEDKDGYRYKKRIYDMFNGNTGCSKLDYRNPFVVYNLQLNASKNNKRIKIEKISLTFFLKIWGMLNLILEIHFL